MRCQGGRFRTQPWQLAGVAARADSQKMCENKDLKIQAALHRGRPVNPTENVCEPDDYGLDFHSIYPTVPLVNTVEHSVGRRTVYRQLQQTMRMGGRENLWNKLKTWARASTTHCE